jgi:hypothetical protein
LSNLSTYIITSTFTFCHHAAFYVYLNPSILALIASVSSCCTLFTIISCYTPSAATLCNMGGRGIVIYCEGICGPGGGGRGGCSTLKKIKTCGGHVRNRLIFLGI